jgi:hypothetical protein
MKERPIIFSGPMVRAILDGRKTQTRRLIPDQPPPNCAYLTQAKLGEYKDGIPRWGWTDGSTRDYAWHPWIKDEPAWYTCPKGVPGDRLWVKETFFHTPAEYEYCISCSVPYLEAYTVYAADCDTGVQGAGFTSCIFMPRNLSRITLEITEVRVQRLQQITNLDAIDEGVMTFDYEWVKSNFPTYAKEYAAWQSGGQVGAPPLGPSPVMRYAALWDSINAEKYPWSSNPWVWAISFRRVDHAL